jgi:microsomal dipeptidase-like Zn-dependent dipeptidase
MNRRDFLRKTLLASIGMALGSTIPSFAGTTKGISLPDGMRIIDAHAHPDMNPAYWKDQSASFRFMKEVGMAASFYAAIGDSPQKSIAPPGGYYDIAVAMIDYWMNTVVQKGDVKIVLKMSDIPAPGTETPGAILELEGGDALEGRPDRVDEFYKRGVRIIQIVRLHNNELGDIMSAQMGVDPGPYGGGLTPRGRAVLDRMQELGVVVDVAHASTATLKDVVAHCKNPILDSHTTTLCPTENTCDRVDESYKRRARAWKEMEWIASTGGVVCSRPVSWRTQPIKTIRDWANELLEMKKRIGIEHIGIGTDGGGIPQLVSGYNDERDLRKLAEALSDVGFSRQELAAFLGGNVYRVLGKYLA